MDIILVRHAEREHKMEEKEDPLSASGECTTRKTLSRLQALRKLKNDPLPSFTAVLSSEYKAPHQTAEMLAENTLQVQPLKCLAPREQHADLPPETLFAEAGNAVTDQAVLAVVGHEPAISRLLCLMTGRNSRRLDRGEAVWIRGRTMQDFLQRGTELVYATRSEDFAEKLKGKIETKMTVCTFLAGFTIAALIEIVKDADAIVDTSRVAAAISFTAALGLFVAAIYIYDLLSMPPEFWSSDTSQKPSGRKLFGHEARLNDYLYAYMVRAWRFAFTPAVLLTMAGFFALLLGNLRYQRLVMPESIAMVAVISGCALGLAIAFLVYRRLRPRRLATD